MNAEQINNNARNLEHNRNASARQMTPEEIEAIKQQNPVAVPVRPTQEMLAADHKKFQQQQEAAKFATSNEDAMPSDQPFEFCNEVEFETSFGSIIHMKRPNVSAEMFVSRLSEPMKDGEMPNFISAGGQMVIAKAMLYLYAINGERIQRPMSYIDLLDVCNTIGDANVQAVREGYQAFFPEVARGHLRLIRKSI